MSKKEAKTLCNTEQQKCISKRNSYFTYTQELFLIENINKHKILSPDKLMEEVQISSKELDFI